MIQIRGTVLTILKDGDQFYAYVTAIVNGETHDIRVPLGDGLYHAQLVMERIIAPAIRPPERKDQ